MVFCADLAYCCTLKTNVDRFYIFLTLYSSYTTQYDTLLNWHVTDISESLTVVPSRDNETGHLVFGMYELPDTESVYWLAPEQYVGNMLKSYGSMMRYRLSWVCCSIDHFVNGFGCIFVCRLLS